MQHVGEAPFSSASIPQVNRRGVTVRVGASGPPRSGRVLVGCADHTANTSRSTKHHPSQDPQSGRAGAEKESTETAPATDPPTTNIVPQDRVNQPVKCQRQVRQRARRSTGSTALVHHLEKHVDLGGSDDHGVEPALASYTEHFVGVERYTYGVGR